MSPTGCDPMECQCTHSVMALKPYLKPWMAASLTSKCFTWYSRGLWEILPIYWTACLHLAIVSSFAVQMGHVSLHLFTLLCITAWPRESITCLKPHSVWKSPKQGDCMLEYEYSGLSVVSMETWSEPVPWATECLQACHLISRSLGFFTCKVRMISWSWQSFLLLKLCETWEQGTFISLSWNMISRKEQLGIPKSVTVDEK